jgi:hypothetical protein
MFNNYLFTDISPLLFETLWGDEILAAMSSCLEDGEFGINISIFWGWPPARAPVLLLTTPWRFESFPYSYLKKQLTLLLVVFCFLLPTNFIFSLSIATQAFK